MDGDWSTVFVRHLSSAVNNEVLQERFSEVGPVKHAFVVPSKDSTTLAFGYVQL